MKLDQYIQKLEAKSRAIEAAIKNELIPRMGVTAVNHFKQNFQTESFDGKRWRDVKRRTTSEWFGFEYKAERRTSIAIKFKGGKAVRAQKQKRLNFSQAATRRKILTGPTAQLGNKITYRSIQLGARVYSPTPYAAVQNNGGQIKVFGKAVRTLPARKFIGVSQPLNQKLKPIYQSFIQNYLSK